VHCKRIRISSNLKPNREAAIRKRISSGLRWALVLCLTVSPPAASASELKLDAVQGFDRYMRLTESRMQGELSPGGPFLWIDSLPEPRRSDIVARLQRGEVISERLHTTDPSGQTSTPGALIHHWVGTVFIPGASLAQVLAVVQDYDRHAEYYRPDVAQSRKVAQNGDDYKVHYRLRKKKIITIILDADYDVHRHFIDATRAYSNSYSTRIAQVENAGQPNESELPPGRDGGYLWRLNTFWRYFDTGRGVYVQCEAISLTRDIPAALNWLVGSFIESVPKESLEFTLQSTRSAVLRINTHISK
jgi:hypothetical protein